MQKGPEILFFITIFLSSVFRTVFKWIPPPRTTHVCITAGIEKMLVKENTKWKKGLLTSVHRCILHACVVTRIPCTWPWRWCLNGCTRVRGDPSTQNTATTTPSTVAGTVTTRILWPYIHIVCIRVTCARSAHSRQIVVTHTDTRRALISVQFTLNTV